MLYVKILEARLCILPPRSSEAKGSKKEEEEQRLKENHIIHTF